MPLYIEMWIILSEKMIKDKANILLFMNIASSKLLLTGNNKLLSPFRKTN